MQYMQVYMDFLSDSPMPNEVYQSLKEYFVDHVGLPWSRHQWGKWNLAAMECFEESVADNLGTSKSIRFTQKLNIPIELGKILISPIESKSVLKFFNSHKYECIIIPMNGFTPDLDKVQTILAKNNVSLLVMTAADRITGTVQPILELSEICKESNVPLLIDISALIGRSKFLFDELGADYGFLEGRVIGAPCDIIIGVDRDIAFPVPLVAAMAKVMEFIYKNIDDKIENLSKKTEYFSNLFNLHLEDISILGGANKAFGILAISFPGIGRGGLSLAIDMQGVAVWAGETYSEPISQLVACGIESEITELVIRFSLWHDTTEKQIDYVLRVVPSIVERVRYETGYKRK